MSEPPRPASIGCRVLAQRYELGELVGRGGMAEVYRAHDRLLDRAVAVKLFRPAADELTHRRFDAEAVALARLSHPGLVSIYDVGSVGDRPFLVMEFIEGTSIQSRLLTGPLPLAEVLRIGSVLAEALAHAHERDVVHRDVKPSNIMLDQDGMPHLTDFGIALRAGASRLTNANEIIGTPAYLAPEQLSDAAITSAVDVYALALVLLECLTGQMEYICETSLAAALSRLDRPPRIPAGLPPAFAALLAAMTSAEAADRPSAAECAARLLWSDEDSTVAVPPATRRGPAGRRRRAFAASVAGVAAVIVALVVLLNLQQQPSGTPLTGGGHAQGTGATGTSTSRPAATGAGTAGPARIPGTLVAKERPAVTTSPSARPVTSSPTATTSVPPTTTTAPPTTTSSAPPTTTTTPPAPTSTISQ